MKNKLLIILATVFGSVAIAGAVMAIDSHADGQEQIAIHGDLVSLQKDYDRFMMGNNYIQRDSLLNDLFARFASVPVQGDSELVNFLLKIA